MEQPQCRSAASMRWGCCWGYKWLKKKKRPEIKALSLRGGGQRGIRTLGRVSPTHAFQACTFNHSVTCPNRPQVALRGSRPLYLCKSNEQALARLFLAVGAHHAARSPTLRFPTERFAYFARDLPPRSPDAGVRTRWSALRGGIWQLRTCRIPYRIFTIRLRCCGYLIPFCAEYVCVRVQ